MKASELLEMARSGDTEGIAKAKESGELKGFQNLLDRRRDEQHKEHVERMEKENAEYDDLVEESDIPAPSLPEDHTDFYHEEGHYPGYIHEKLEKPKLYEIR